MTPPCARHSWPPSRGDAPDLWPLWDATAGLPAALIRGANSDLLSAGVAAEMLRRRPDAIFAEVPGRAHVPWLDEPESLTAINAWLDRCGRLRSAGRR